MGAVGLEVPVLYSKGIGGGGGGGKYVFYAQSTGTVLGGLGGGGMTIVVHRHCRARGVCVFRGDGGWGGGAWNPATFPSLWQTRALFPSTCTCIWVHLASCSTETSNPAMFTLLWWPRALFRSTSTQTQKRLPRYDILVFCSAVHPLKPSNVYLAMISSCSVPQYIHSNPATFTLLWYLRVLFRSTSTQTQQRLPCYDILVFCSAVHPLKPSNVYLAMISSCSVPQYIHSNPATFTSLW